MFLLSVSSGAEYPKRLRSFPPGPLFPAAVAVSGDEYGGGMSRGLISFLMPVI
jgi:hypothetical protein